MVNYNVYAFNRNSINMIHTTIYIIYQIKVITKYRAILQRESPNS